MELTEDYVIKEVANWHKAAGTGKTDKDEHWVLAKVLEERKEVSEAAIEWRKEDSDHNKVKLLKEMLDVCIAEAGLARITQDKSWVENSILLCELYFDDLKDSFDAVMTENWSKFVTADEYDEAVDGFRKQGLYVIPTMFMWEQQPLVVFHINGDQEIKGKKYVDGCIAKPCTVKKCSLGEFV